MLHWTYSCPSYWEEVAAEQDSSAVTRSVTLSWHSTAAWIWQGDLFAPWQCYLFLLTMVYLLLPGRNEVEREENGILPGHFPYIGMYRGAIKREKTMICIHATSLLFSVP